MCIRDSTDARLFKKTVGGAFDLTAIPTKFDVIKVGHTNADSGGAVERYLGYSNVANQPFIKAYDKLFHIQGGTIGDNGTANSIRGLAVDGDGYLTVTINGVVTGDMEVLRFQQNAAGGGKKEDYIAMFGSDEIAIKNTTNDGNDTTYPVSYTHLTLQTILRV